MILIGWLSLVVFLSLIIHRVCGPFSDASHYLGRNIPGSIRGATIDAIASSTPELFTTLFFLILYNEYESGVATCAGSAVYNMIVIPAICALLVTRINIQKEVIWRDGLYFVISEIVLIIFLTSGVLEWWMGLSFLGMYCIYLLWLYIDARRQKQEVSASYQEEIVRLTKQYTTSKAWLTVIVTTCVVAVCCYSLVRSVLGIAFELGVAPYLVAVILAAAATSLPDTFFSINSIRKGDHGGAISNAFGSNIFDINVTLGLPVLIYCLQYGSFTLHPVVAELRFLLLSLTIPTLAMMVYKYRLTRRKAVIMLFLYLVFLGYAVFRGYVYPPVV